MGYSFGKKSAKQNKLEAPPSPDEAAASAFGRYLRYGRASRFGNQKLEEMVRNQKLEEINKMMKPPPPPPQTPPPQNTALIGAALMNFVKDCDQRNGQIDPMTCKTSFKFGSRRSRFGRHYFGRYPQFGKKVKMPSEGSGPQYFGKRRRARFGSPLMDAFGQFKAAGTALGIVKPSGFGRMRLGYGRSRFGQSCGGGMPMGSAFGRRGRKGARKGGRKHKKPPARLIKMCKRHGIKCTKKAGKRRVYKSVTVLKRQLKKKMKHRKGKRSRKTRRTRRRRSTRFSLFGFKI